MRDTIFISHATPEDNEFTIWLASRLEQFGYNVWIDKNELLGGEVFWSDIENAIVNKAIKVLLVYSNNICYKDSPGEIKDGIQKEINFTNQVITDNPDLKDFFILLHIDDSSYNLFPGSSALNQISFSDNWSDGLTSLLKKLKKDEVPAINLAEVANLAEWYLDHYIVKNPIIKKEEIYYTNWWSVDSIPPCFYIMRFANEAQAQAIQKLNENVLLVLSANCIISFNPDLDFVLRNDGENAIVTDNVITPSETFEIKISELLLGYKKDSFPSFKDAENYFKRLLKRALHLFFKGRKMSWYEMANKNLAYYHTLHSLPTRKVTFKYPNQITDKAKKKNLIGKYLTIGKWHYAISIIPSLYPYLGFHIKSHLIFTQSGFKAIEDKESQHMYRRKKGKRMFNEEWRDLLMGFISSLQDTNSFIQIRTDVVSPLILKNIVEHFTSEYGYFDPKDLQRQELFTQEDRNDLIDETI